MAGAQARPEQPATPCFWPKLLFAAVVIVIGFLLLRSEARREAISTALSAMWHGEPLTTGGRDPSSSGSELNLVIIEQEKFRDDHGDSQGGQDNPYYRHPFTRP